MVSSTPAAAIYAGNVTAGKDKALACAACHGADGNSLVPIYPNLAGQSANYIAKQLADFKSGKRSDPVMAGMVAALTSEDMNDLAAYFAVQSAKSGTGESNEVGHKLYLGGDAAKGVTACIACHGVAGKGMKQAGFPSLTGQSKDYLKKQLTSFRDGSRGNDNNGIMRNIAIKLSDADIDAVAQYITSLK
ncbi:c-type cytochrome [Colwellia piezophila]|uniref:c-type cytochrome n=1 Tax=Colwellia piezophila TaxID=211668 RepID=UPI001FE0C699|nr:c-type cytochrome [Colwellia piezophila]